MTAAALAQYSILALYTGMAVLGLAMLAFALHIAGVAGQRSTVRAQLRERELAGVTAGAAGAGARKAARPTGSSAVEETGAPAAGARAGGIGMSLTWLAFLLLLASLVLRGLVVMRAPIANLYEFAIGGVIATLGVYLAVALRRPLRWLGLFIVTPSLLVLGLAVTSWYTAATEVGPALQDYWLAIHVPIAVLSVGLFTVAFAVLVLQMLAERRETALAAGRSARMTWLEALPPAARLDRLSYSLHVAAFPLWTFTIVAGAIWGQKAWGTYWSWDPKETWSFVVWVIYAAYLHARATSGWKRRATAWIAVAGYVAILLNTTVVNKYFSGLHSYSGL
ncbi:c-type cytochrome biogenesis protein CcsB [Gephyromycinifex aptenodytis]|uniref:c-type cytochrome biogenesis protein CcsB n=1 Tax=Gephyromycinifex aptenodytis TaxID=2716227 RepID=UPI001445EB73|nr:c-type cytochrome biogenesis protein CcsB [Gephyromycinifex aptenodytis]